MGTFLDELAAPGVGVLFMGILLAVAYRLARKAGIYLVQRRTRQQQASEPQPLRRVVLDATARFPPKAQDRRRVG